VTLNTSLLGVMHHACTRTPLYQSAKFEVSSFASYKDLIGAKFNKHVTWTWPRPY